MRVVEISPWFCFISTLHFIRLCESFPLSGGFLTQLSKHTPFARISVKKVLQDSSRGTPSVLEDGTDTLNPLIEYSNQVISDPISEPKEQLHIVLYPTQSEENHATLENEIETYMQPSLSYSEDNVEYVNAKYNQTICMFCEILPLDRNAISEFLERPRDDIEHFVLHYYAIEKPNGDSCTCLYVFKSDKQPNSSNLIRRLPDIKSTELIQYNNFLINRQASERITNRRKKEKEDSIKTNDNNISSITPELTLRTTTQASLSVLSTETSKDVDNKYTSYYIQSSSESQVSDNSVDVMELEGMKESRSPPSQWYGIIGGVPAVSSGYLVRNRGIIGN